MEEKKGLEVVVLQFDLGKQNKLTVNVVGEISKYLLQKNAFHSFPGKQLYIY